MMNFRLMIMNHELIRDEFIKVIRSLKVKTGRKDARKCKENVLGPSLLCFLLYWYAPGNDIPSHTCLRLVSCQSSPILNSLLILLILLSPPLLFPPLLPPPHVLNNYFLISVLLLVMAFEKW
jgi:hypothetical protein